MRMHCQHFRTQVRRFPPVAYIVIFLVTVPQNADGPAVAATERGGSVVAAEHGNGAQLAELLAQEAGQTGAYDLKSLA